MNDPNIDDVERGRRRTSVLRRARGRRMTFAHGRGLRLGALSVAAVGALVVGLIGAAPAALADDYPSWDDVQAAKANEAAAGAETTRVQGLISGLTQRSADAKAAAEQAGNEYFAAQQALFAAAQRATDLQAQADTQKKTADDSANRAGQVAAQLSRTGGDNTSMQLFFSGSKSNADQLLQRLGQMDRLLAGTQAVYDKALVEKNTAKAVSDQAVVARTERDRLDKVAQDKLQKAQAASKAADAALADEQTHLGQLQAQLAALQDTTAKTVAGYQAGEAARAAAAAAAAAAAEAARQAAAAAAASGGGGGGGGGGGSGPGNGWVRPYGGWQSSGYGPRVPDCNANGCSSSFHYGVDLADGRCGSPIYAAHDGVVTYAGYNGGYGNYIRLDNGGGIGTGYAHIEPGGFNVSWGDWVSAGQVIAYSGNTGGSFGCHLHFEVYQGSQGAINPIIFMENRGVDMS
ncbi:M23 family metallopeptidase [Microbacterium capsulatum]|uniref:M23 family metallopeptidase n=1 Tax=Microbacterium capsulatum TaxID=3041921 RepID=A0ABU0XJA8_9MICO|nr:M23 family metallopeptidase [Microbacterium sp. ASV81]MDQ4215198.1 M23 family metallopeptidase [Microbacterium sp. ASV81]